MVDKPDVVAWHPAFCAATSFELREDSDAVEFIQEYNLSKEPLRADLLILKKEKNRILKNEIGKIFKTHNVIEYKSPVDGLNIDDFFKTIGYACIYKSQTQKVNLIPAEEITVSMFRNAAPRALFSELKGMGYSIVEEYPGIYYVYGNTVFTTQIVVTGELSKEHSGLRILSNKVKMEDAEAFLEEANRCNTQGERNDIDAILQVSVDANRALYEEIRRKGNMCEALKELMKDEIAQEVEKAVEQAVSVNTIDTKFEDIKNMMKELALSADRAMEILRIPEEDRYIYFARLSQ